MNYQGAIVDLDGTVYRGDRVVDGAAHGIQYLREQGLRVLFVTNKPIHDRQTYIQKLQSLSISVKYQDIVTSASITAEYLVATHPDRSAFVIGETPLVDELEQANISVTEDVTEAQALVVSLHREFNYQKLSKAMHALDDETVFLATNLDRTCPVEDGEIPDTAGMIGAVEHVTDRSTDLVVGKPSPITVKTATDRIGLEPSQCLMVGDRLETDIEMGERAGMTTVLVLSGVTSRNAVDTAEQSPDHIIDSLSDIDEVISSPSSVAS
jgi:arabinose operon protein AraL